MANEFKGAYFQMKNEIMEAYLFLRKNNITVPSDSLEFMKDAAIDKLDSALEKSETSESNAILPDVVNTVCDCKDDESAPIKWICTKCNKEFKVD